MNIAHRNVDSIDIVAISGELVMANSPDARQQLHKLIDNGNGNLILDLSNLNFVDSSGLSVLVSALKATRTKQGQIALLKPMPEVRSLIELTRLHQIFDIFEDEATALIHLNASPSE